MLTQYSRNRQLFVRYGFGTIVLGIIAVVWPVATLCWITLLFGVHAFANGLSSCVGPIKIAEGRLCRIPVSAQVFERFCSRR